MRAVARRALSRAPRRAALAPAPARALSGGRVGTNAPGAARDKLLFTPGPLSTSHTVKAAMLRDLGSRDAEFVEAVRGVRAAALRHAGVDAGEWSMVPMQGSGTFGVEAVVSSVVPQPGKGGLLLVTNGAYGDRIADMARVHGMHHRVLSFSDREQPDLAQVDAALADDPLLSHVAVVHSETTSGIFNDVAACGEVVRRHGRQFIVDAMSSFFAYPLDLEAAGVDYLVTSSNKCIQGVPGFAIVIARNSSLASSEGCARTLSLDVHAQLRGLDGNGQFRFTPPTHAVLAAAQAFAELEEEGGVGARHARYVENQRVLSAGMRELGFEQYVPEHLQGPIILTYLYPADPKWSFEQFYSRLSERGMVIYPGKVTQEEAFRVGNIGHLFPEDMEELLGHVREVVAEMGFDPRPRAAAATAAK